MTVFRSNQTESIKRGPIDSLGDFICSCDQPCTSAISPPERDALRQWRHRFPALPCRPPPSSPRPQSAPAAVCSVSLLTGDDRRLMKTRRNRGDDFQTWLLKLLILIPFKEGSPGSPFPIRKCLPNALWGGRRGGVSKAQSEPSGSGHGTRSVTSSFGVNGMILELRNRKRRQPGENRGSKNSPSRGSFSSRSFFSVSLREEGVSR